MAEHHTSLGLPALKEILAGVNRTLAIYERSRKPLVDPDDGVGITLRKLQAQLENQIKKHPANRP